jgi:hypothetical protein
VDLIDLAQRLSGLSAPAMFAIALITGYLGWWGFTWSQKAALALKDELIAEVRKDRDYWRDQAIKGVEMAAKQAEHQEEITSILERVTGKAAP